MNNYSKKEKIRIVINFTKLLRNYPSATGERIDIYKSDYSFIEKFKEKSMHIDGIKEISFVDGYEVLLKESFETHDGEIIQYDDAKEL